MGNPSSDLSLIHDHEQCFTGLRQRSLDGQSRTQVQDGRGKSSNTGQHICRIEQNAGVSHKVR